MADYDNMTSDEIRQKMIWSEEDHVLHLREINWKHEDYMEKLQNALHKAEERERQLILPGFEGLLRST